MAHFRTSEVSRNAYKHLYEDLKPGRAPRWTIASGGSLDSVDYEYPDRPIERLRVDYESDPEDTSCRVIFRRRDGSRGEFLATLERVVAFWSQTLYGNDV